jgi:ADP-dependent NAD(P)H-hydrate dehydratase / NAD(P)H-hydrate epimerase
LYIVNYNPEDCMKVVSHKEMNEIDRRCIMEIGIPGMVLMENAALRVVEEIEKDLHGVRGKRIVLFAGKGNNGGDAFAAARHLFNKGAQAGVILVTAKGEIRGDALMNLEILEKMGLELTFPSDAAAVIKDLSGLADVDLIVDGIFGTGFRGEMEGIAREAVERINQSKKRVLSIDIPSGVEAGTGQTASPSVRAHKTVTFGLPKTGLLIHPGCEHVGELVIADIGIPPHIVEGMDIRLHKIERSDAIKLLPSRPCNSNKGDFGRVLVISGSVGMTGAGCLSAEAALRTGAGLVYLGVPAILSSIYDTALAESITLPLEDGGTGYLVKDCMSALMKQLERCNVVAAGPGLSSGGDIPEIVAGMIENAKRPLILDADALNAVAADISILGKKNCDIVITPHPGEMARIMGISIQDVQNNRIKVAREFAAQWKVIVVLKGARTIVALPDGTAYINTTGNPGMATGGTGDVLTGIIAGLAGQGLQLAEAAVAGVYIHGRAGDEAAAEKGMHGLIAGDLVRQLPYTIRQLAINKRGGNRL